MSSLSPTPLVLTLALLTATAAAEEASGILPDPGTELPAQQAPLRSPPTDYWIPALVVPAINITIWAFNRYVTREDFARISPSSIWSNVTGPWVLDEDGFEVNQMGHPYQGSLSFAAARSAGVGFWTSALYTYSASLMWELAMETDPPSVNDQITTSISGVLLGEALHKLSGTILDVPSGRPGPFRETLAAVVNPMGAINRHVFGMRHKEGPGDAHVISMFHAGITPYGVVSNQELGDLEPEDLGRLTTLGVRVYHGVPFETENALKRPFDHFTLDMELSVGRQPFGLIQVNGLLAGADFGGDIIRGVGGLYGFYEFYNPTPFRSSVSAIGPAATLAFGETTPWFLTIANAFVPLGAAGQSAPVAEGVPRDYHFGQGTLSQVSVTAVLPWNTIAAASARHIYLGSAREPGWENLLFGDARLEKLLYRCHGIGVRWQGARREASFENGPAPEVRQRKDQIRVYWTRLLGRPSLACEG